MPKRGLYCAYLTGVAGSAVILFLIEGNQIHGIDPTGTIYDGNIVPDENGNYMGTLRFSLLSGTQLITGQSKNSNSEDVLVQFTLGPHFADGQTITRLDTPIGPINARFVLIKLLSVT